jgi:hypothetical protein
MVGQNGSDSLSDLPFSRSLAASKPEGSLWQPSGPFSRRLRNRGRCGHRETIAVEKCGLCGGDSFTRDNSKDSVPQLMA